MTRVLMFNDTRVDHHHGCTMVVEGIERALGDRLESQFNTVPAHFDWYKNRRTNNLIANSDLVLVNGEGTIHHDAYQGRWLLEAIDVAKQHDKPVAVINMSWQDNPEDMVAMLASADLVSVRDKRSQAELKAASVNCRYVPDMSLGSIVMPVSKRAGIGFTDSVVPEVRKALARQCRIMDGIPMPIQYPDAGILGAWRFLRAVLSRDELTSLANLVQVTRDRYAAMQSAAPTAADFVGRLKRLRLLVSGRYHACTLAVLTDTPFIAAGTNTAKISDLIDDVGLDPQRKAPELSEEMIHHFLVVGWSDDEAENLREFRNMALSAQSALFDDIAALAR